MGVIEKVRYSEWAAPIVPVVKPDNSIRVCGDYKVTVNSVLEIDQHPLPNPEELFVELSEGEKFSKPTYPGLTNKFFWMRILGSM